MEDAATGHVLFGLDPLWVSTALLIATYAAIMTEKLNRAIVALLGAGLMIALGILNQEQAVEGIDFNTLALLTGMMLIVAIARKSGIFQYVAIVSAKAARASPAGILVMLGIVTAMLSALLDNVTTVLLIAPVTLVICRELNVKAYPFLFAEIFASNIGGTATLIGDPPNIIIGSAANLSFMDFVYALTPVVIVILLVNCLAIHLIWGRSMTATRRRQGAGHGAGPPRRHHRPAADAQVPARHCAGDPRIRDRLNSWALRPARSPCSARPSCCCSPISAARRRTSITT